MNISTQISNAFFFCLNGWKRRIPLVKLEEIKLDVNRSKLSYSAEGSHLAKSIRFATGLFFYLMIKVTAFTIGLRNINDIDTILSFALVGSVFVAVSVGLGSIINEPSEVWSKLISEVGAVEREVRWHLGVKTADTAINYIIWRHSTLVRIGRLMILIVSLIPAIAGSFLLIFIHQGNYHLLDAISFMSFIGINALLGRWIGSKIQLHGGYRLQFLRRAIRHKAKGFPLFNDLGIPVFDDEDENDEQDEDDKKQKKRKSLSDKTKHYLLTEADDFGLYLLKLSGK